MADTPEEETYFDQAELSDVRLKIGEVEICAHRYILCRNSMYFRKVLLGGFAENGQLVVHIEDDDTASTVAMIRHIYGLSYFAKPTEDAAVPTQDVAILTHARVYVTAEKYGVVGLKDAVHNNIHACMRTWRVGSAPYTQHIDDAIRLVCTGTPATDTPLRPTLVRFCADNIHRWNNDPSNLAFPRLLADFSDLAPAILTRISRNLGDVIRVFTCPGCGDQRLRDMWEDDGERPCLIMYECVNCRDEMDYDEEEVRDPANWNTYQVRKDLEKWTYAPGQIEAENVRFRARPDSRLGGRGG